MSEIRKKQSDLKVLIPEMMDKMRDVKGKMISLLERSNQPNITKEKMQAELFKLYMEMK